MHGKRDGSDYVAKNNANMSSMKSLISEWTLKIFGKRIPKPV